MRRIGASCAIITACFMAGCSNVDRFDIPRDPNTGTLTPASIIKRFKCEMAQAAADPILRPFIEANDLVVGAQLDLAVTDDGSLAPTFTYTQNPMFSFSAGARYEISRAQTFTARVFIGFSDIRDQMSVSGPLRCPKFDTLLAGDLGVLPTMQMALATPDLAIINTKLSGVNGVFGGSVNFMVTKNLNAVGPTYTLTHFKGPGGFAGVSELNNDKITFAFAARKAVDGIPAASKIGSFIDTLILGQVSTQLANNRAQP